MTLHEFKQLKVSDRVTHPAFIGFLTIIQVETSANCTTSPPTPRTEAIILRHAQDRLSDTGHRLKACGEWRPPVAGRPLGDEQDVRPLRKLP